IDSSPFRGAGAPPGSPSCWPHPPPRACERDPRPMRLSATNTLAVVPDRAEDGLGRLALLVLLGIPFMAVLDAFVTLLAAPSIQTQLHVRDAGVQLIVAGYVTVYA